MVMTIVQMVVPAVVLFTTLFGLLARGNPKPGGVALFLRVGLVGIGIGAALWYLVEQSGLITARLPLLANLYRGIAIGGILLTLMGVFGNALKRER